MLKSPYLFAVTVLLPILGWTTLDRCAQAAETTTEMGFELSLVEDQSIKISPRLVSLTVEKSHEADVAISEAESLDLVPVPSKPIPINTNIVDSNTPEYVQEHLPPFPPKLTNTERFKPKPVNLELEQLANAKANSIGLRFAKNEIAIANTQTDLSSTPTLLAPVTIDSAPIASKNATSNSVSPAITSSTSASPKKVELSFETTDLDKVLGAQEIETLSTPPKSTAFDTLSKDNAVSFDGIALDDWIFEDGSNSLVARTVGSAEGTRHWSGDRTSAYYGHVDPGNGVWNLGTFSYQHGADSPEEADRRQLERLKSQGHQIQEQAARLGIQLSLEEKLNALDLANQAPLAALDRGGYIERLAQAQQQQMKGGDAILWARTYAYLDPDTRDWNAPGLGNNVHSISRDQERRIAAISKALEAYSPNEKKGKNEKKSDQLANSQSISLEDNSLGGIELGETEATRFSRPDNLSTQMSATQHAHSNTRSNKQEISFELPASGLQINDLSAIGKPPTIGKEFGKESTIVGFEAPSSEVSPRNDVPVVASSPGDEPIPVAQTKPTNVENANVFEAKGAKDLAPSNAPLVNSSIDSSIGPAKASSSKANKDSETTDESSSIKSQPIGGTSNADRLNTDRLKVSSNNKAAQRRLETLQQEVLLREKADIENTATESQSLYRIENRILP